MSKLRGFCIRTVSFLFDTLSFVCKLRFSNFLRGAAIRIAAVLILASMVMPGLVIDSVPTARAAKRASFIPPNAPPMPFRLFEVEKKNVSVATAFSSAAEYLRTLFIDEDSRANDPRGVATAETQNAKQSGPSDAPVRSADTEDTEPAETVDEDPLGDLEARATEPSEVELAAPMTQPAGAVDFDFDGDGKTDLGRWQPQSNEFKVKNSGNGSFSTWSLGTMGAKPAPADYDGDGATDAAVFNNGTWTIRKSSDGQTTTISGFGQSGDIPASGNYHGGSADELAYFRPSNGTWYWREFSNSTVYSMQYGSSSDIPAAGDYDGDGDVEPAVYRPSTGTWWISSVGSISWGVSIDIPVPADFDGDGKTDPTVFRPSTGGWWSLKSSTSYSSWISQTWGQYGDQPVAGDFDDDSKADFAIWRPTSGVWYIFRSSDSGLTSETLGVPGDTAVASSYVKQVGSEVTADVISKARLLPKNATGGTNLYSQNFSWGTSLVGLPGRSGLDLNLGLSYNSLVWTKVGNTMLFDTDVDNVSPGFRLGFPTIEPAYYDDDTDKWSYLMVTPSGARVQFRGTDAGDTYLTNDSSYARLVTNGATNPNDPVEDITITVTGTDGTQMAYEWTEGAFRCTEIKDRNGNYISVTYNEFGQLATVTDTLGRVINLNYDTYGYLSTITQTWRDENGAGSTETHTWATFTYTTSTIATDFDSSLTVLGASERYRIKGPRKGNVRRWKFDEVSPQQLCTGLEDREYWGGFLITRS